MRTITLRDESSGGHGILWLLAGALLGVAGGVLLAERVGGWWSSSADADDDTEDEADDAPSALPPALDARVLEAYANDPILAERPIEIEERADGVIALTGRVRSAREIAHAVTIARGIPGVREVRQRLQPRLRR